MSPEIRLAHDIAAQFRHRPLDEAARAVADHMRRFWDPRMRARLTEQVGGGTPADPIDPLVAAAAALLKSP